MSEIPRETVLRAVLPILSEAFAGPANPRGTHFANNQPDCELFGTLAALTAEEASAPVEHGGSTAAAQAEHVRLSLDASTRWMRGDRGKADRARSWEVTQVDDDAWTDAFVVMVHQQPMSAEGRVATVAHAAYRLGALRQIARYARVRAEAAAA